MHAPAQRLQEDIPRTGLGAATKPRGIWLEVCLLVSLAQVLWLGYQFGVGNQGIQIAFLKKWLDPKLFARDLMVGSTLPNYPSFFFRALAWFIPSGGGGVTASYFVLHLAVTFATIGAIYWLAKSMFDRRLAMWSGVAAIAMISANHLRPLAGDDLYSPAFTHTWVVFPLALFALALLYRGQRLAAFIAAGLIFNLHALTGAYLAVMLGAAVALEYREIGWRRLLIMVGAFVAAASPTLVDMAAHRQHFDAAWVSLTHLRSGDHSFPSTWWQSGSADVPRFALVAGLWALSLSFSAPSDRQRRTLGLAAGAGFLFLVGFVFSEWLPVSAVLRAQLFRSSRLLLVIFLLHIGHGIVRALAMPCEADPVQVPWRRWLEAISAAITLACLAVPPLLPWLPVAFVIATVIALTNARLSWPQASGAGAVILICLLAARKIHFPLYGAGTDRWAASLLPMPAALGLLMMCLAAAAALIALARFLPNRSRPWLRLSAVGVYAALATSAGFAMLRPSTSVDPWREVQLWARDHTPVDAVFLTPAQPGGFRIGSERAVVAEWRDGTQAYFDPSYGTKWLKLMGDLQPGMVLDADGKRVLARGKSIDSLDDPALVDLAKRFSASYIVLPAASAGHKLPVLHLNAQWILYEAKQPPAPVRVASTRPADDQKRFMEETVYPNIEKYRKGDVKFQVVDADGRPMFDMSWTARQTTQSFGFGCSLPFFVDPKAPTANGDFRPPVVRPEELERCKEIFNFSVIPFSAKWMYTEAVEGKPDFTDLDAYVDWCAKNGIRPEFHFVTGYQPAWMGLKRTPEERTAALMKHATDVATRYGDRIKYWQVVNEKQLLMITTPVFAELRKLMPDAKLGISDCARFYDENKSIWRGREMFRGLEEVKYLKTQGVKLDFFAVHGHRPLGLWPDPRDMYETLNTFAAEGVKVHISEFTIPTNGPIIGPVRTGKNWTPALQAECYEQYYTVCFSHPAVEMVNLWGIGPVTWQTGSGLLDDKYQPKPVFNTLKDLIRTKWMTTTSGKLGLDGSGTFRGFHGEYELTVTLADGTTAHGTITDKPEGGNTYRLHLDKATNTLRAE